jgi:hypothetical protein
MNRINNHDMKHFESILAQLPSDYVNYMGREGLEVIYDFNRYEAGMEEDEVTPNTLMGWRKYHTPEDCAKELGLTDCETWNDIVEYYPVYDMLSDGTTLVAVD